MRHDRQAEDANAREGLRASWPTLSPEERVSAFRSLAGEDAQEEEATEEIQELGGMEALDMPYISASFPRMIRKRAQGAPAPIAPA